MFSLTQFRFMSSHDKCCKKSLELLQLSAKVQSVGMVILKLHVKLAIHAIFFGRQATYFFTTNLATKKTKLIQLLNFLWLIGGYRSLYFFSACVEFGVSFRWLGEGIFLGDTARVFPIRRRFSYYFCQYAVTFDWWLRYVCILIWLLSDLFLSSLAEDT